MQDPKISIAVARGGGVDFTFAYGARVRKPYIAKKCWASTDSTQHMCWARILLVWVQKQNSRICCRPSIASGPGLAHIQAFLFLTAQPCASAARRWFATEILVAKTKWLTVPVAAEIHCLIMYYSMLVCQVIFWKAWNAVAVEKKITATQYYASQQVMSSLWEGRTAWSRTWSE